MIKHIWLSFLCLTFGPLAAETVGNVEFQFPPSNYEWKILFDQGFFIDKGIVDEDEDRLDTPEMKVFTHREGDALELLFVLNDREYADDEDDDEEMDTIEIAQKELDEELNQFFPNHRLILNYLKDDIENENGFLEWELNDGNIDIVHGFTRAFMSTDDRGVKSLTMISYLTTAVKSEYNRIVWTDVLNQAKILK